MRVSEYIAQRLADFGVSHVFMLTGGGAMFLNDAIGNQPEIQTTFNHHEQACAIAAEGYARVTGLPGVINVTTGPGGINAMNGVFGAWTDSIPMLVISGQVKRETLMTTYNISGLRQIGDQEADIISMIKGITKYAVTVHEPESIRYHLEKAWYVAQNGRPGPVWLDIPIDVQTSSVEPQYLSGYVPDQPQPSDEIRISEICIDVFEQLISAERPVILAGKGIRLGDAIREFEQVIHALEVPVVTGWTSIDLMASDDPLFCGRPGDLATRAGNFTVQNADVLLVLGNRLGLRQVSYNWKSFARFANIIQVDVDAVEFKKPTVRVNLPIHSHVKPFLVELYHKIQETGYQPGKHAGWLAWCRERVAQYPVVLPHHRENISGCINPYHFIEQLSIHLNESDVVVCGDGTANVVTFQAITVKKGMRVFANTGNASMGYDLPAAIGSAVARDGKRVICLAGDGSLQLNIQELQTVVHNRLPIKLFVLNNNGYLSIRLSQRNMFNRLTGEGPKSGVSFPDIVKLSEAYGIPVFRFGYDDMEQNLADALSCPGPVICDVLLDPEQPFEPRITAKQLPDGRIVSSNLEEMFPFLDEKELAENMIAPEWNK